MTGLRHLLRRYPALGAWVVAMTLATRLLVPGGFMLDAHDGAVRVVLCSGSGPQMTMVMSGAMSGAMPGMAGHGQDHGHGNRAEQLCAFAGLTAPSLTGDDPVVMPVAVVPPVLVAASVPAVQTTSRPDFLRPPLRGPPGVRA